MKQFINNLKSGWNYCNSQELDNFLYIAICVLFPAIFLLMFLLTN